MRPRRILLVRLSAIGDIVFASPLIDAFRRAWPDAHLAWLAQPECAALLRGHPALDEVIEWPYRDLRALARSGRLGRLGAEVRRLVGALRARHFDLAVDLQGLLKSALPVWLSGAPERIGLGSREGSHLLMTRVIGRGGDSERVGSEYLHLAETLGLPVDDFAMRIYYDADARRAADALIKGAGLDAGYSVICPFTTRPQKHWFEDRWAALAIRLQRELNLPVLMLGGPADRDAAARIQRDAGDGIVNLAGETSLLQAAALIDSARLLIGVDTGLSHMGIAFQRPTLLLFGSTCPYLDSTRADARVLYHRLTCSPCRRHPTCDGAFTCMRLIDVDEVMEAVRTLPGAPPVGPTEAGA